MSRWLSGARGVAVVVAHPDDETWGLGSRLEWLAHARFVYTTDGGRVKGADFRRRARRALEEVGG